jgi:hypothetical protein
VRARLIVSILAGLFVVGGCAGTGTPAATVNGDDIDRSAVDDLIAAVQASDDPAIAAQFEPVPGVFPAEFAAQIMTVLIQDHILVQAVDELGLEISADDLAAAQAQGQSSGFDEIDELSTRVTANAIAVGDIAPFFAEAEVKVDPRYGVWDSTRAQVVPPAFADQVG